MQRVICVGNFDGVHLGHVSVLAELEKRAEGRPTVVLSFERHPMEIAGSGSPPLLTDEAQKLELLEAHGVDIVGLLGFDERIRFMTPESFVEDVLVGRLNAAVVVVGADFRFGFQRSGDVATLVELGQRFGFETAAVDLHGEVVPYSASAIRDALRSGRTDDAARLLGRPYQLRARVVPGDGRGRTIGFPTANLDVGPGLLIPARGVYAVLVTIDGVGYRGVANVGVRPTFGGETEVVEVHVFDLDEDLYDRQIHVDFVSHIRNERRFDGVEELVAQINRDAASARQILG